MSQVLIKNIIRQLYELQDGSSWFDQCFKDKIGGLTEMEAFTRPHSGVHSVAEHVSHILEWRKECLMRFSDHKRELMHSPDDWKDNTVLKDAGWEQLKNRLYESTAALIQALEHKDDTYLETRFRDTDYNFHYLIEGIIHHDLYHLGQIGITIKLLNQDIS
jgi:uncharacterized damage-inducible protein DinB